MHVTWACHPRDVGVSATWTTPFKMAISIGTGKLKATQAMFGGPTLMLTLRLWSSPAYLVSLSNLLLPKLPYTRVWPSRPWSRIHIDFAGPLNGKTYLVIVDAYSKWPEVASTTSAKTIDTIRHVFAGHGLPD